MEHIQIEHPGILLKEDFLEDHNLGIETFANAIGVSSEKITQIIHGQQNIDADLSVRIGVFFGMSPGFWLNLQTDFDLRLVQNKCLETYRTQITPFSARAENL